MLHLHFYFSDLVVKSNTHFLLLSYFSIFSIVDGFWAVSGKRFSFLSPVYLLAFYLLYGDQNFDPFLCHIFLAVLRPNFPKLLSGYENRFWNARRHLPAIFLGLVLLGTRFSVPNIVKQRWTLAINLTRECVARNELRSKVLQFNLIWRLTINPFLISSNDLQVLLVDLGYEGFDFDSFSRSDQMKIVRVYSSQVAARHLIPERISRCEHSLICLEFHFCCQIIFGAFPINLDAELSLMPTMLRFDRFYDVTRNCFINIQ